MIQTGWSEALPMLMADKELWITGAPQTTKLVLLVVWKRLADNKLEAVVLAFRPGKPRETYVSRDCDLRLFPCSLFSELTLAIVTVNFLGD